MRRIGLVSPSIDYTSNREPHLFQKFCYWVFVGRFGFVRMTDFSATQDRRNLRRWGSLLFVLILLGFCSLFVLLTYRPAAASEVLPISIQSLRMADYSAGTPLSTPLPPINLEIIPDTLNDREPTNVPARFATVQVILLTPVPTVTPSPTPTPFPSSQPTPTSR